MRPYCGWRVMAKSIEGEKMQLYRCDISGTPIYFENTTSLRAGNARVGFVSDTLTLHTLKQVDDQLWSVPSREGGLWRFCQNAEVDGSNWLIKADDPQTLALPARYNRIIPNIQTPDGLERFRKIGAAQRHLFYSILRFGLACPGRDVDPQ